MFEKTCLALCSLSFNAVLPEIRCSLLKSQNVQIGLLQSQEKFVQLNFADFVHYREY